MIEQAIESMKEYYGNEISQIDHTLKVLNYAEKILNMGGIAEPYIENVTKLACIYHDIGIPEARKKYGSSAPRYQELEGPEIARSLMNKANIRRDILERVCFIVGNHHTQGKIDGMDFQIVWEADLITNVLEGWTGIDKAALKKSPESSFKTKAGIELISKIL